MPSFTFVSTANAFVLRGAIMVFVDVRPDTLNIDETIVEEAITPRTRAVVAVHYAGVGCDMDSISRIARHHGLWWSKCGSGSHGEWYQGRPLGSSGQRIRHQFSQDQEASSRVKAVHSSSTRRTGVDRAEILWERAPDRTLFDKGRSTGIPGSTSVWSVGRWCIGWVRLAGPPSWRRERLKSRDTGSIDML